MPRKSVFVLPVVTALAVLAAPSALAAADPVSTFDYVAEKGASPISDSSRHWAVPADEVVVREIGTVLRVDAEDASGFDYVRVNLTAPGETPLQVGHYDLAKILIIRQGLGCDSVGSVTVDRIDRNDQHKLTAFDGSFEQRCSGPGTPAIRGQIHFHA